MPPSEPPVSPRPTHTCPDESQSADKLLPKLYLEEYVTLYDDCKAEIKEERLRFAEFREETDDKIKRINDQLIDVLQIADTDSRDEAEDVATLRERMIVLERYGKDLMSRVMALEEDNGDDMAVVSPRSSRPLPRRPLPRRPLPTA